MQAQRSRACRYSIAWGAAPCPDSCAPQGNSSKADRPATVFGGHFPFLTSQINLGRFARERRRQTASGLHSGLIYLALAVIMVDRTNVAPLLAPASLLLRLPTAFTLDGSLLMVFGQTPLFLYVIH